ncbi:hypothetical protein PMJ1TS6_42750 [Paenibacillus melissococcoides]
MRATVTVPMMVSVPNPACFMTLSPIIGPMDMARLVDKPKYPIPSPIRGSGMIWETIVGIMVLPMPNPMPYPTRISRREPTESAAT